MNTTKYQPRLKIKYQTEIIKHLQNKFQYKNPLQVPRLVKIVINQGIGEAVVDKKLIESSIKELAIITGQKPIPTISKKDISNFKLRKGVAIGVKVTLRGNKMYEFLDRLIASALPRIRDFKGLNPKSFDGKGNYNLGISEQIIFPEIDIDKINKIMGMDINIVTTAKTDKEALELLKEFGMPFKWE